MWSIEKQIFTKTPLVTPLESFAQRDMSENINATSFRTAAYEAGKPGWSFEHVTSR